MSFIKLKLENDYPTPWIISVNEDEEHIKVFFNPNELKNEEITKKNISKEWNKLLFNTGVTSKNVKLPYNLFKTTQEQFKTEKKDSKGNEIIFESIEDDAFFPKYAVGRIYKKIFFMQDKIDDAIISNSITEVSLDEYTNVSKSQINNFYNSTINFIKNHINHNNNIDSTAQSFDSPFYHLYYENKYPHADIINYSLLKNDLRFKRKFSYEKEV